MRAVRSASAISMEFRLSPLATVTRATIFGRRPDDSSPSVSNRSSTRRGFAERLVAIDQNDRTSVDAHHIRLGMTGAVCYEAAVFNGELE
jgi:hypothetical protein